MRYLGIVASIGLLGLAMAGCRDNSPAVPAVVPPELGRDTYRREVDYRKPMPDEPVVAEPGPQPFYDEPLLVDPPPETKAFVDIYRRVGRPRIVVFVNRSLDGQILPTQDAAPERVTERVHKANTAVTVERNEYEHSADRAGARTHETKDKFESKGPADYTETTTVYLKPGEYDDVRARGIDYGMMETLLADWMSADGQVSIVSPMLVQKKLSPQQVKDLQAGQPQAMAEVAESLDADVLIQVQARPTRQTGQGLDLRLLAEAMNLRGGDSLARAVVDLTPPMDKYTLNRYTRFLARKLMDGMTQTWSQPRAGGEPRPEKAPSAEKPAPELPPLAPLPPLGPTTKP